MINEMSGTTEGSDVGGKVREDNNKVTEQDVKRVQSGGVKAKKVQDEIKAKKKENNDIANFLAFLLKSIKNEQIISTVYNTFFKVIDPKTGAAYLRKTMNNIVIIGFFAPFFPKELAKFNLTTYFQDICKLDDKLLNLNEYISYIKRLSKKYHDNVPINQNQLMELLALIIGEFGIDKSALGEEGKIKMKNNLINRLK